MSSPSIDLHDRLAVRRHCVVPASDLRAPEIRVRGQLIVDAIVRFSAGGQPLLECVITQRDGTPIVVRRLYGPTHADAYAASSLVHQLRRGGMCTAYGDLLAPTTFDGRRALQLRGVTLVEPR